jgi:hypothetical protein
MTTQPYLNKGRSAGCMSHSSLEKIVYASMPRYYVNARPGTNCYYASLVLLRHLIPLKIIKRRAEPSRALRVTTHRHQYLTHLFNEDLSI